MAPGTGGTGGTGGSEPPTDAQQQKVYVVLMGMRDGLTEKELDDLHLSYLTAVKGSLEEAKASVVYHYSGGLNGFAARLSSKEVAAITEMDGVGSVMDGTIRFYPDEPRSSSSNESDEDSENAD